MKGLGVGVVAIALSVAGCTDKAKESEKRARAALDDVTKVATEDVAQIERGLPEGAARLSSLWANGNDPHDGKAIRSALLRIRREVPDLTVAKSTFFALADDKGIAIRNDLEEDAMAGKDLRAIFPDLGKAIDAGTYVATTGKFPGPDLPSGPDKDWLAAAPVKTPSGALGGLLVTGWTFKRFAYHLEETLRHDLTEKQGNGKLPIVYVLVFDGSGAYGTRAIPAVNAKALGDLGLPAKTASGPAEGTMAITDRDFGWAAARVPKMGSDVGVAVMWSEL